MHTHPEQTSHQGAHVISAKTLLATWGALMVLTGLTVAATWINLGSDLNLVVAMVIATIKAILVALIFMHLLFDQKFNLIVFVVSVLTVVLFVSITFIDVSSYQPSIRAREALEPNKPFLKAPEASSDTN
ncbi:MAG: cytochrome C oxidase subunit IV family protein [Deltaproteobacteria bacterium]|nr:cytochrome C oxidase subunit IV family protein [Deltaproteobacteria bacterium]